MTDYPVPDQAADRWAAGASRPLTIPVGDARTALLQAIRALGFTTTSEQYSIVEAERGSKFRGLSLTRACVPVGVGIAIAPDGTGFAWRSALRTAGALPRGPAPRSRSTPMFSPRS